ncbi:tetrapeptide repeat homeobox protein 2 [Peromyscus maniculatus bairdii]|uniref:tetrapeptide repeat homeobox protein 2 n=1 Tax=Peromyscus maniculatus bairdii TaxID=230844 RepID=UPI003FD474B0
MGSNSPVISGSQVPQEFPLLPGVIGRPSVLPSNKSISSPVTPDTQGSTSASVPPIQQGFLVSQVTPMSQDSPGEPRKKRTFFTQEQKLVLEEHFKNCIYVSPEQCMALAQRFGLKEHIIKMWFKNRRAKEKQKNAQELTGNPGCGLPDRPAFSEGCASLAPSINGDALCQNSEKSLDQKSNLFTLGQVPEEVGFRKSPAREKRKRQKDRELPGRSGHQSSGRSGLGKVSVPLPGPGSSQPMQERTLGVSSPPPLNSTTFTEPQSISCITQTNQCLLNEVPAAGDRLPGQSADCAFSASPTLAHDVNSIQSLESRTSSKAAPETAKKAAERVKETPSVNSNPETKDYQDSSTIQDQLFLQQLCELDASIVPLSPPDYFENFSLLEFF